MPRRRYPSYQRVRRRRRRRQKPVEWNISSHVSREISGIFFLGFSALNFLSLENNAGSFGQVWYDKVLQPIFGVGAFLAPVFCLAVGLALLLTKKIQFAMGRVLGLFLFIVSALGLIQLSAPMNSLFESSRQFGGYVGFSADFLLFMIFGTTGTTVIVMSLAIISLLLIFNISFTEIFSFFADLFTSSSEQPSAQKKKIAAEVEKELFEPLVRSIREKKKAEESFELNIVRGDQNATPPPAKEGAGGRASVKNTSAEKPLIDAQPSVDYSNYEFPELSFLNTDDTSKGYNDDQLVQNAEIIRRKLEQFGLPVTMKDAHVGPTVIQYTLKPAEDVKLSKITTLKNDLCLALSAQAIRIEAPIPGKGLVGIEVPAQERMIVHLGSLIRSPIFSQEKNNLTMVLGRDVSGHPMVGDLTGMPHLLVAGQTGSGKSIAINSFLVSLLYQHSPKTLRLIMIDPKRVELTNYNGIPHLLTPVITEPDKALQGLKWAVSEMNRRYKELASHSKRNIDEYNKAFPENPLPFIVIIIDELADLMMAASKEIEATICRIAQLARATGIHLIIATQRPSVDVITGLIKANIPTRIAFTVATGIDSRTIIDAIGAEDLIGQGDFLYLASNMAKPMRLQGAYVSTKEVEKVIHFIKLRSPTGVQYDDSITSEHDDVPIPGLSSFKLSGEDGEITGENDLERAIQAIKEGRKASASYLQRRCSFGYAKAARILDQLEEMGLIGPSNGAKPRTIFMSSENESTTVTEAPVSAESNVS